MKKTPMLTTTSSKAQSFMELAIVLPVLLLLVTGVVEMSVLLNTYITVTDATRQGVRWGSVQNPYSYSTNPSTSLATFCQYVDWTIETHNDATGKQIQGALYPLLLSPDPGTDDVLVTLVTVNAPGSSPSFTRTNPTTSGCDFYGPGNQASKVTDADIQTAIDANVAPDPCGSGLLIVEVFYNYGMQESDPNRLAHKNDLRLPWIDPILGNPVHLYGYTIMPMPSVKPYPAPAGCSS